MNLNKEKKKNNKSIEITNSRNIRVKGTLKWPANISWTQDSETLFKSNAKNEGKNKNMTAFDRNQVDSVKYLIEGIDNKTLIDGDKSKKINKKKNDLSITNNKRLSFDNKEYSLSRAQKLANNYSILEDEKKYKNNLKINSMGNKYEIKEYKVIKPGNLDIFEFEKLLKSKGIHLIEINEKKDIINNNRNIKDRILQIKIRENIFDKKKNDILKNIEKELKKKNRQIQIKQAPKQKNHRLKSADFMYKKSVNENKSLEKSKS